VLLTFVELRDAIEMAWSSVRTNKLRSALTILGVMVGVSSVIGMAALINGLNLAAEDEIDSMGSNIIMVTKYGPTVDYDDLSDEERNRSPITVGEAEAILANCPSVDGVAPHNYYRRPGGNEAKFKNRKFSNPSFMGTWPDYAEVRQREISAGRFLSSVDEQFRLMSCVIGADIADVLFEEEESVGKQIRINNDKFTVVGVYERTKSNFGNDFENRLISVPLSTYLKLIPWEKELALDVRARSRQLIDQAKEEITSALRIYRNVPFDKGDNFALATQDQFKEEVEDITSIIYMAMIVITSVGLMVGGIGVMNIMLVSVTERTREIGVRKAIGAKRSNITLQFLTEAMSLSGLGGIVGVVVGILMGVGLNSLIGFPVNIPMVWVVTGFTVSVTVGLVSGVYPAMKAARLDPIEALRYE